MKKNKNEGNFYKQIKLISLILSLLILILFIYSLMNYEILKNQINENLNQQVIKYGYIAVFILSFLLEISLQPFASAIVPFANGLILNLDFRYLLIFTLLGVILSSFTAYVIGRVYGKKITIKIVGKENYEKYFKLFEKYGQFGMTIAALSPLPYFPILAGLFKMNFKNFITFAIIPRIIHFLIFGYILYSIL